MGRGEKEMLDMCGKMKKNKDGTISKISFQRTFNCELDDVSP